MVFALLDDFFLKYYLVLQRNYAINDFNISTILPRQTSVYQAKSGIYVTCLESGSWKSLH